jgi:predicted 2-oxoglutarate/Fe(II)-dependent dioxygenase YbiX
MLASWLLHQVTPVTRGARNSMAVWIRGPAWR